MLRLDETDVERRLAGIDLVALLRDAFAARRRGEGGGPPRAVLALPTTAWFAAMPAWTSVPRRAIGAKLVIAMPGNAARGLPTHRAVVVLFDPDTGTPAAWVEADALTCARTAAVSVVATQAMAARPRGRHAILGCGAQAAAHARAFARAGLLEHCTIWSRTAAHAGRLIAELRADGIAAAYAVDPAAAVSDADVVTTVTAAREPLFRSIDLAPQAHVNAVGACVADRREVPGELAGSARIAVDDLAAAPREAGDIILAVAEGAASWDDVLALDEVLALPQVHAGGKTLFVSLGTGIADVTTAAAVCDL